MDSFDKAFLAVICVSAFIIVLTIISGAQSYEDKELLYKNCLDNDGLLVQEYGSTIHYCAEVKRIRL